MVYRKKYIQNNTYICPNTTVQMQFHFLLDKTYTSLAKILVRDVLSIANYKSTKIWKQFRHIMVSCMRMLFYRCRGTLSWTLICICVATVQHCRWQDMGQDIHKTWHHMLCSEIKGSSVCSFWGQKGLHVSALLFAKHIWTWTAEMLFCLVLSLLL